MAERGGGGLIFLLEDPMPNPINVDQSSSPGNLVTDASRSDRPLHVVFDAVIGAPVSSLLSIVNPAAAVADSR